jgi:hypothetical protein
MLDTVNARSGSMTTAYFANGRGGREKQVADPLTCTPPRNIRARFRGYKHTSLTSLVWRVVGSGDHLHRIVLGLYAVMVMVILSASAVAELLVFARLSRLGATRDWWSVGDNASAILTLGECA